ncbi:MAG: VOC family protein [Pseudomonadota bacterium]
MLTFDHIAIATETLDTGADEVAARLGMPMESGGQHTDMGTHNRLFSLGPSEYAEVIAVDPDGTAPTQPRWFNLDNFAGPTRTTNWICACPDLDAALAEAPDGAGIPWDLARGDLSWRMAIPKDGKLPFDGLFPAMIQWKGDAHPAPRLADRNLHLARLRLISPQADALLAALTPLISDDRVQIVPGAAPHIEATLATPGGEVTI